MLFKVRAPTQHWCQNIVAAKFLQVVRCIGVDKKWPAPESSGHVDWFGVKRLRFANGDGVGHVCMFHFLSREKLHCLYFK